MNKDQAFRQELLKLKKQSITEARDEYFKRQGNNIVKHDQFLVAQSKRRYVQKFKEVWAIFNPKNVERMRGDVEGIIGVRLKYTKIWDVPTGDYAGQQAFMLTKGQNIKEDISFIHFHEEDLDQIERISP